MTVWLVWVNDACTDVCATEELAQWVAYGFRRAHGPTSWVRTSAHRWHTPRGRYARLEIEKREVREGLET